MKYLFISIAMLFAVAVCKAQQMFNDTNYLPPVEVNSVRASEKSPFAKTNISKAEIKENNIGQDIPFIINNTPSVVANSDAGNGVGYTGIRIRGTDATRINVTLNGIPYNDAESLGTFFVDIPDIASSASSIQIQRGVGTSANGAGSFGGSININTNDLVKEKNIEINTSVGSFGLIKNTVLFNSGILKNHFTIDARMSNITSDGYIDRAFAKLKSYYLSAAYTDNKNTVRLNIFTGREKTYQAYYGILEDSLKTNRTYNSAGTEKIDEPYKNQVDDYTQTHFQLFYSRKINNNFKSNVGLFLTKGSGFYEQYKADQKLQDYGLSNYGIITNTDMINQLWLKNNFFGTIFSLQYENKKTQIIFGGGYTIYEGHHFGNIIWAKEQAAVPIGYEWYNNPAKKIDFSSYLKWSQSIGKYFQTFIDVQLRKVDYNINGFRNNPTLMVNDNNLFFNPKFGINYSKNDFKIYASFGKAIKEPNRDDYEGLSSKKPNPEKLNDIEIGTEYHKKNTSFGANLFYMSYKNQLVLIGNINDVGAYTRTNIDNSFRAGAELFGAVKLNKFISLSSNITFSKNKIKNFVELIDNYDNVTVETKVYKKTDIAFSPYTIGNFLATITPLKNTFITLISKYVSKQYLDNTSNNNRRLNAYFTQDVRIGYNIFSKKIKEINLYLQGNNLFSKLYEPNGYTFSYISNSRLYTQNYYFPMAPINIVFGVNIRL